MKFQDLEKYVIQGAKLGKKIARQVKQANFERTVTTNKVESWHGYGYGDNKGNHRLTSFVGAMYGAVVGSVCIRESLVISVHLLKYNSTPAKVQQYALGHTPVQHRCITFVVS